MANTFIRLTTDDGKKVYVNLAFVASIEIADTNKCQDFTHIITMANGAPLVVTDLQQSWIPLCIPSQVNNV